MDLGALARLCEEAPWCGTKPRGPSLPHPHPNLELQNRGWNAPPSFNGLNGAFQSQGMTPEVYVACISAIAIYQAASNVPSTERLVMTQAAERLFEYEGCGSVPLSVILITILHNPPPPPPPWVERILFAARTLEFAASLPEGQQKTQLYPQAVQALGRALAVIAEVELNPQPLPPGRETKGAAKQAIA